MNNKINHLSKFEYLNSAERYNAIIKMFFLSNLAVKDGMAYDFNADEKESIWMEMGELLNADSEEVLHELANDKSKFNHLRTAYHILIVNPFNLSLDED